MMLWFLRSVALRHQQAISSWVLVLQESGRPGIALTAGAIGLLYAAPDRIQAADALVDGETPTPLKNTWHTEYCCRRWGSCPISVLGSPPRHGSDSYCRRTSILPVVSALGAAKCWWLKWICGRVMLGGRKHISSAFTFLSPLTGQIYWGRGERFPYSSRAGLAVSPGRTPLTWFPPVLILLLPEQIHLDQVSQI